MIASSKRRFQWTYRPWQRCLPRSSLLCRENAVECLRVEYGAGENQGDSWLRGHLGQAATGAARTPTFPGERYGRIARRRGKAKAQVAVACSILIIIWHLLKNPEARYTDLGAGYYQRRTDTDRKIRNHIRQIQALGFEVTITKTA